MRRVCPVELKFDTALEKAKESLRKARQRHTEDLDNKLVNLKLNDKQVNLKLNDNKLVNLNYQI